MISEWKWKGGEKNTYEIKPSRHVNKIQVDQTTV